MFELGFFYTKDKKHAEAFKWQMKSAQNGVPYSMNQVVTMYLNGAGVEKNTVEGLKWLKKAAKLEHAPLMTKLGEMYESGIVVERDIHEALKWYVDAANAGEVHAQQRLETLCKEVR